ncbi:MAG: enoyl-CoA hydratase/isomerase family protein [Comamonadaceae bacterium]|nr:MAG: enoyl-CoA hydratase/isomerase family protein [Comamonadaceae bacterium]
MSIQVTFPEPYIAVVTIANAARRNAITPADCLTLGRTWEQLGGREDLRCVVLTGEGQAAFCAGASLDANFSVIPDLDAAVDKALLKTVFFPLPLVAAINGHCVAGGFELMLASDVRVASSQARLGLPEVHWGIMPSGGGAMKLIEQIGYAPAMQMMLTAELITADEALALKLVNQVVEPGEVLEAALKIARQIAGNSPVAVRQTKQAAIAPRAENWRAAEPEERQLVKVVRASDDAAVGRAAFLNKVVPVYR